MRTMIDPSTPRRRGPRAWLAPLAWIAVALLAWCLPPRTAQALPLFARQTGQNCLACHAGGQFPELTPYGRMFKLTGYTIGTKTLPLSVMGVASYSSVADTSKSDSPGTDFYKNKDPIFATGSVFAGGRISDNVGAFVQLTYDRYGRVDDSGNYHGTWGSDNMELRYADRRIDDQRDLIWGVSANNNPSVSDPWNTAAAWMQYVPVPSPSSSQFIDGTTPYPGFASDGNVAGVTGYLYWNRSIYAELGTYRTSNKVLSFLHRGNEESAQFKGNLNPYWRVAYNREWGASSLMVGATGMYAKFFDADTDHNDPGNLGSYRDTGIDAQYQYLLDPHTVTAQLSYMRHVENHSPNSLLGASPYFLADGVTPVAPFSATDTTHVLRMKLGYVYRAKFGGSLAYFNLSGNTNTENQSSGYDSNGQITSTDPLGTGITSTRVNGSLTGNPATRGTTWEVFWLPVQYVRVGAQYTAYSRYNGAGSNYDGFGRNARDNNSLFLYVWAAY